MRILLTDVMFPNKYAKWRIVEILSFINKYETDILVLLKACGYGGIEFNFDYEEMKNIFHLDLFDILIFNPKYNYINNYNSEEFDGTKYNNISKGDYLFKLKKYRNDEFNINVYDNVYHIFLVNYKLFNEKYNFPQEKQIIHLYPGGGLENKESLNIINKNVKIVSTSSFCDEFLKEKEFDNFISVYGASFYMKNEKIKEKTVFIKKLNVCFSSLGSFDKGSDKYLLLIEKYKKEFPEHNIKFYGIGNCPKTSDIIALPAMSQHDLDLFYYRCIDVMINGENGRLLNGFPLGVESAMQGCILLTTDTHNMNQKLNFGIDPFFIINDVNSIVDRISQIYNNMEFRKEKSKQIQNKVYELFNYEKTQQPIFGYIEKK